MSKIVCATRGGEGSRAVQIAAIEMAKQNNKSLVFLFVTDTQNVGQVDAILKPAIYEELNWMGNTLLRIAKQRASAAHIQAEVVIKAGDVQEEISRFLRQSQAELLLLGAPRGTTANVFGDDAIEQFALSIQEMTGIPVQIIRPEHV